MPTDVFFRQIRDTRLSLSSITTTYVMKCYYKATWIAFSLVALTALTSTAQDTQTDVAAPTTDLPNSSPPPQAASGSVRFPTISCDELTATLRIQTLKIQRRSIMPLQNVRFCISKWTCRAHIQCSNTSLQTGYAHPFSSLISSISIPSIILINSAKL